MGLTSDEDAAQKDKATGRGLQRKMENGPRKSAEASEIVWVHLSSRDDNVIHLGEFHRDYGHRTDDCIQLRKEIEYLIRCGYLQRFIAPENQPQNHAQNQAQAQQPPPPPWQTTTQHQQPLREIHVISGGFVGGGESSSARKAHLRSIRSGEVVEV